MRRKLTWLVLSVPRSFSQAVHAQSWQATVGAQSADKGVQALAFCPRNLDSRGKTASTGFPRHLNVIA